MIRDTISIDNKSITSKLLVEEDEDYEKEIDIEALWQTTKDLSQRSEGG